jgi:hypothetical protein
MITSFHVVSALAAPSPLIHETSAPASPCTAVVMAGRAVLLIQPVIAATQPGRLASTHGTAVVATQSPKAVPAAWSAAVIAGTAVPVIQVCSAASHWGRLVVR